MAAAEVGAQLRFHHGDVARVVADEGKVWRLDSGRIAKKATEHEKWEWIEPARALTPEELALPPVCPWRLEIVRAVLLGTHDAQSPLCQLRSQHRLLELIIRGWVLVTPEVLVNSAKHWAPELFLDVLIAEMLEVNPGVTEVTLRNRRYGRYGEKRLELNRDGSIKSWDLSYCRLRALPELFGAVTTTGNLWLHDNELTSLPDSFGSIRVGGSLGLANNQLTALPDSFGLIIVERSLLLTNNHLDSLPTSFGSIAVDGELSLRDNDLTSLPDSFGSIIVGDTLLLYGNQLSSLPESFGSITVGGDLHLYYNPLDDQAIPTHFPNVGGKVHTIDSDSDY